MRGESSADEVLLMKMSEIAAKFDTRRYAGGLVSYDASRKRLWLAGQRLHHGLTGAALAGVGITGLAAHRLSRRGGLEWTLIGSALMVHDWHDRSVWFKPGRQDED